MRDPTQNWGASAALGGLWKVFMSAKAVLKGRGVFDVAGSRYGVPPGDLKTGAFLKADLNLFLGEGSFLLMWLLSLLVWLFSSLSCRREERLVFILARNVAERL